MGKRKYTMKLLLCAEFYYPSIGGVQEVVRQLAERFAHQGHDISIATTALKNRNFNSWNQVNIFSFSISGNNVRGLQGELSQYQNFVLSSKFDLIFIYAAQQWTFDGLWPILDQIKAKKIIVPCGYSGLQDPAYKDYFKQLPDILRKFDHIIYHAEQYRDFFFGQQNHLDHFSIIPNGADITEFSVATDQTFRQRMDIPENAKIIMTVGTFTGTKGHLEILSAFEIISKQLKNTSLILNGNTMPVQHTGKTISELWKYIAGYAKTNGWYITGKVIISTMLARFGVKTGLQLRIKKTLERINANKQADNKVIICNLPRQELIQAYLNADIFVFASNIEYSPLVLYEACAAGLPFISVPVGNAKEITVWTGGGEICPAPTDEKGYTRVNPEVLAAYIIDLLKNEQKLLDLSQAGKKASQESFNWDTLYKKYENLFISLIAHQVKNKTS